MTDKHSQVPPDLLMRGNQEDAHKELVIEFTGSRQIRLYKGVWPQYRDDKDGKWRLLPEVRYVMADSLDVAYNMGWNHVDDYPYLERIMDTDVLEADE